MAIGKKTIDLGLTSYDKLFMEEQEAEQRENIQQIPLEELHPFKNHPFRVLDDEKMAETVDSVREFGVLVPAIARPRPEGGYELIAGHRRHRASVLAGKETMPVIIRDMDDDAATIIMVDSNLQRETLLFSEKAWAYRMKLEAMNRQGRRTDLTSSQVGTKLQKQRSDEILAKQVGESRTKIQRYIRLTYLIKPLLGLVDVKRLALGPSHELSFISKEGQEMIFDKLTYDDSAPSAVQAQQLRQLDSDGKLNKEAIESVMDGRGIAKFYSVPLKEESTQPTATPEEPKGPEQSEPADSSQQAPELVQPENVVEFPKAPAHEQEEPSGPAQPEAVVPEIPQSEPEPPAERMDTAEPDPARPSEAPQIPPEVVAQAVQQAQQQMTPPPPPPQPAEDEISINITIKKSKFQKYFPKDTTPAQMEQVIIKLLEDWYRKRQMQKGMSR